MRGSVAGRSQRNRSQRGNSVQRQGGQPRHKGATLRQTDRPGRIETHRPQRRCPRTTARACRCGSCGYLTRAVFPKGVQAPVQYGPHIAATVVYLPNAHCCPKIAWPRSSKTCAVFWQLPRQPCAVSRRSLIRPRTAAVQWSIGHCWLAQLRTALASSLSLPLAEHRRHCIPQPSDACPVPASVIVFLRASLV